MTYNTVGGNSFRPVKYHFNADNPTRQSPLDFGNRLRIPLQPSSEKMPFKDDLKKETPDKTNDKASDKATDKSADKTTDKPADKTADKATDKASDRRSLVTQTNPLDTVEKSEKIKPNLSEMPEIAFVPQTWSRDLVLFENKKPAISKTYHFNYGGKNFAGIITDSQGKIYIYDRSTDFHRPLKHLQRFGDTYSGYHAGFREEKGNQKPNGNYIDLGTLEVLQAALQSSVSGKYNVAIHNDDSFMTNWMRATSPNNNEKLRYWNDNVVKLSPKYRKNILLSATPILIGSAILIPSTLLGISLANEGQVPVNSANVDISNAGKIALTAVGSATGAGLAGYGFARLQDANKRTLLSNENTNFKTPNSEYTDTLIEKSLVS